MIAPELQEPLDPKLLTWLDKLSDNQDEQDREAQELSEIKTFEQPVLDVRAKREIATDIAALFFGQKIPSEVSLDAAEARCEAYQQSGIAQAAAIEKAVEGLQTLRGKLAELSVAELRRHGEFTYSDSIHEAIEGYLLKLREIGQLLENFKQARFDEDVPPTVNRLVSRFEYALCDFILAGRLTDQTSQTLAECIGEITNISSQMSESDGAKRTIEQKISDMDQNMESVIEFVAAKSQFELIRRGEKEYGSLVLQHSLLQTSAYPTVEEDVTRLTNSVAAVSQGLREEAVSDLQSLKRSFSLKKTSWQKLQSLGQSADLVAYLDNFSGKATEMSAVQRAIQDTGTRLLGPKDAAGNYAIRVLLDECIAEPEKLTQNRIDSILPPKSVDDKKTGS